MPGIPYSPDIRDLFANLQLNWSTMMPILVVLFGVIFGTFLAKKIMNRVRGE